MTRAYLIHFLTGEGCFADPDFVSEVGEMWRNSVNGDECLVPFDEEVKLLTYCHIFFVLKVGPPQEYDADYHVYTSFLETPEVPMEED